MAYNVELGLKGAIRTALNKTMYQIGGKRQEMVLVGIQRHFIDLKLIIEVDLVITCKDVPTLLYMKNIVPKNWISIFWVSTYISHVNRLKLMFI